AHPRMLDGCGPDAACAQLVSVLPFKFHLFTPAPALNFGPVFGLKNRLPIEAQPRPIVAHVLDSLCEEALPHALVELFVNQTRIDNRSLTALRGGLDAAKPDSCRPRIIK